MRLSIRIISLIFLGVLVILIIDSYYLVRRDIRLFDFDMQRDALHFGHTVLLLVRDIWQARGQEAALEMIRRIEPDSRDIHTRWVWLDDAAAQDLLSRFTNGESDSLLMGKDVSFIDHNSPGVAHRYTYVPMRTPTERIGALQLSEPLTELNAYTRQTILRSILFGFLVVIICLILLWSVGIRMMGRPLSRLVEQTERIGMGDFSHDLEIRGRDELSILANAMNRMCSQLAKARDAVEAETEAKLNALEQLRHAERLSMLGRISSGLAHELGTPLNVVSGRANMIANAGLEPEEIASSARIIGEQADRMAKIIRQLLDYSRRRTGQRHPESIELLAKNVLDMLKPIAEKANVSFELIKRCDLPMVLADRFQLEQTLMNLVMNGIQAMPQGGLISVELGMAQTAQPTGQSKHQRDCIVVKIVDEGVGIAENDRELVLEPFFTTKQAGQGTGLGMSIAQGIIEEHGGWLQIDSEVGHGTTVTIFLPLEAKA